MFKSDYLVDRSVGGYKTWYLGIYNHCVDIV